MNHFTWATVFQHVSIKQPRKQEAITLSRLISWSINIFCVACVCLDTLEIVEEFGEHLYKQLSMAYAPLRLLETAF